MLDGVGDGDDIFKINFIFLFGIGIVLCLGYNIIKLLIKGYLIKIWYVKVCLYFGFYVCNVIVYVFGDVYFFVYVLKLYLWYRLFLILFFVLLFLYCIW